MSTRYCILERHMEAFRAQLLESRKALWPVTEFMHPTSLETMIPNYVWVYFV